MAVKKIFRYAAALLLWWFGLTCLISVAVLLIKIWDLLSPCWQSEAVEVGCAFVSAIGILSWFFCWKLIRMNLKTIT